MRIRKKQGYWQFEILWSMPFSWAVALLFSLFVLANVLFSLAEWGFSILNCPDPKTGTIIARSFGEYLYFGFITGLTIGYGDYTPCGILGKALVVVHGLSSALAFALVTALTGAKALSPRKTIVFSKKLLLDRKKGELYFRVINTHKSRLLNLQVRVAATQHAWGNMIAGKCTLKKEIDLPWLDRHDFTVEFPAVDDDSGFDLVREWEAALSHNKTVNAGSSIPQSRFKVEVLILGTYRTQSYAQEMIYWADDIAEGIGFKAIQYNKEDQRRILPIRYTRFPDFWGQFDAFIRG